MTEQKSNYTREDVDKFYRKHRKQKIFLIGKFFGLSFDQAEDIFQTSMLKALQNLDRYDPTIANFSTWFNSILFNEARHQRRTKGEKYREEEEKTPELIFDLKDIGRKIIVYTDNRRHKTVLRLFYLKGYTGREIANMLGDISVSNVTTICNRFKVFLSFDDDSGI